MDWDREWHEENYHDQEIQWAVWWGGVPAHKANVHYGPQFLRTSRWPMCLHRQSPFSANDLELLFRMITYTNWPASAGRPKISKSATIGEATVLLFTFYPVKYHSWITNPKGTYIPICLLRHWAILQTKAYPYLQVNKWRRGMTFSSDNLTEKILTLSHLVVSSLRHIRLNQELYFFITFASWNTVQKATRK